MYLDQATPDPVRDILVAMGTRDVNQIPIVEGERVLRNFVLRIAGCRDDWNPGSIVDNKIAAVRELVGEHEVQIIVVGRPLQLDGQAGLAVEAVDEFVATLTEHIEVPIQAGDDEILARMRRGYTADDYRKLVARIREMCGNGETSS